jgi:hypothetical protein
VGGTDNTFETLELIFFVVIAHADIYPKIDENYRVQTSGGAMCKYSLEFFAVLNGPYHL